MQETWAKGRIWVLEPRGVRSIVGLPAGLTRKVRYVTCQFVQPRRRQTIPLVALIVVGLGLTLAFGGAAGAAGSRSERSAISSEARVAGEPIMAVVSLRRQQITIYDAAGWILRAPVSSGQSGRETPAGIFSVIQKDAEHYSNLYDDAFMPHMQRLTWSGIESGLRIGRGADARAAQGRFQPDARFARPPAGNLRSVFDQTHHMGAHAFSGQRDSQRPAESAFEIHLRPDSAAHFPGPQSAAAIQLVRPRTEQYESGDHYYRFDHSFSDRDKFYARYTQGNQTRTAYSSGTIPLLDGVANYTVRPETNHSLALELGEDVVADVGQ